MRIPGAVLVMAIAFALAAPAHAAGTLYVSILDNSYSPASLTVNLGDTVMWCNDGDNDHSIVSDEGLFGSGTLRAEDGDCYSYRPSSIGTFRYDCNLENIRGTLTVREAPPPAPATTVATSPAATSPPAPAPPDATGGREQPPPTGRGGTLTTRAGATATTGRPTDVTIEGVVIPALPELPDLPTAPADIITSSTAGQFAINEVGSERDRGQLFAVFASAAVVALGAGYLLFHLRFGRRG